MSLLRRGFVSKEAFNYNLASRCWIVCVYSTLFIFGSGANGISHTLICKLQVDIVIPSHKSPSHSSTNQARRNCVLGGNEKGLHCPSKSAIIYAAAEGTKKCMNVDTKQKNNRPSLLTSNSCWMVWWWWPYASHVEKKRYEARLSSSLEISFAKVNQMMLTKMHHELTNGCH